MKVIDILNNGKVNVSCELFPPKVWSQVSGAKQVVRDIAKLSPSFMSVTYGAGGGTSQYTVSIAENLQNNFSVPSLAHLSCVSSTKGEIKAQLDILKEKGIEKCYVNSYDWRRKFYNAAGFITEDSIGFWHKTIK